MLTRQEAERLSQAINALRPEWPIPSLLSFLKARQARPLLDIGVELTWVALDPETKTPARIDQDGPWKRATAATVTTRSYPEARPGACILCGVERASHGDRAHDYENPLDDTRGVKPTPEQRAAIDKAKEDAHMKATAVKEAAEERKRRSVEEVLAAHKGEDAEVGK